MTWSDSQFDKNEFIYLNEIDDNHNFVAMWYQ